MTTPFDVPHDRLVIKAAEKLRGVPQIQPPEWTHYVKTGVHREKPPESSEWWHPRVAAVLRKVYLYGPIGAERMRATFGGKRDRGAKPFKAARGSGSIAREALQQLEAAGLIEMEKGKGRRVSAAGMKFMDNVAHDVKKELVAQVPGISKY